MPHPTFHSSVLVKDKDLAFTPIALDFVSQVKWDLDGLVNDIVNWLKTPGMSNTSKVGTLSSPYFLDLLESLIEI